MSDGPTITVRRAMELLHCSRSRVFELLTSGTLARAKRFGRATTITTESVLAALEVVDVSQAKRRRVRPGRAASAAAVGAAIRALPV